MDFAVYMNYQIKHQEDLATLKHRLETDVKLRQHLNPLVEILCSEKIPWKDESGEPE